MGASSAAHQQRTAAPRRRSSARSVSPSASNFAGVGDERLDARDVAGESVVEDLGEQLGASAIAYAERQPLRLFDRRSHEVGAARLEGKLRGCEQPLRPQLDVRGQSRGTTQRDRGVQGRPAGLGAPGNRLDVTRDIVVVGNGCRGAMPCTSIEIVAERVRERGVCREPILERRRLVDRGAHERMAVVNRVLVEADQAGVDGRCEIAGARHQRQRGQRRRSGSRRRDSPRRLRRRAAARASAAASRRDDGRRRARAGR